MIERALYELAKSYGLVETVYCDGHSGTNGDETRITFANDQQYNYLIVIDFEATCWQPNEVKWKQPEIIGNFCNENAQNPFIHTLIFLPFHFVQSFLPFC